MAGRPTDYRPEYVEKVAGMCLAGATDLEISDEIGVSIQTLYNWRAKYPEFLAAMRYGKDQADERVERGLYQRAVGFEYPAVKISFDKEGTPLFAQYREYYPPDASAAKHWLNNRKPKEWREKIETEHSGNVGVQLVSDIPRPERK
jgi:Homeodomain-like domain